jgi:hypothetical protein
MSDSNSLYLRFYGAAYETRLGRSIIDSRWLARLSKAKWWVLHRFHPRHRYHILNTGLGYGWRDRDVVLEHVVIQLMIDFVEKEKPFDHFDTEASHYAADWVKLREVYDRCKAWKARPDVFVSLEADKADDAATTELLIDIIRLRDMMWT